MIRLGNTIDWKGQDFKCTDCIEAKRGNMYTWEAKCHCGNGIATFTCYPWFFPFATPPSIAKYKHVKTICKPCLEEKNYGAADPAYARLLESFSMMIRDTLSRSTGLTTVKLLGSVCKMPDDEYKSWFLDGERDLAISVRVKMRTSYRKHAKSAFFSKILTEAAKKRACVPKNGRWYDPALEINTFHRKSEALSTAAQMVKLLLELNGRMTAAALIKSIESVEPSLSREIKTKFSINGTRQNKNNAMLRVLQYLRDELKAVSVDSLGRGALWYLVQSNQN